jgi:hypothetical protein
MAVGSLGLFDGWFVGTVLGLFPLMGLVVLLIFLWGELFLGLL